MTVPAHARDMHLARALAVLALAACGEGASDGNFEGEPLFTIGVTIGFEAALSPSTPRAALVWLLDEQGTIRMHPDDDAALDIAAATVTLSIFAAPDDGVLRTWPGVTGRFALGQVVVYDDLDGDARFTASDTLLGTSEAIAVYTHDTVSGDPIGPLTPGFALMERVYCPREHAFDGVTASAHVALTPKPYYFQIACAPAPPNPCSPLEVTRHQCRWRPDAPICDECPNAVFPENADKAACNAWHEDCLATYPDLASECDSENVICVAGEPRCSPTCHCQFLKEYCLDNAEPGICQQKYGDCSK